MSFCLNSNSILALKVKVIITGIMLYDNHQFFFLLLKDIPWKGQCHLPIPTCSLGQLKFSMDLECVMFQIFYTWIIVATRQALFDGYMYSKTESLLINIKVNLTYLDSYRRRHWGSYLWWISLLFPLVEAPLLEW